jgi:hypothetical protein
MAAPPPLPPRSKIAKAATIRELEAAEAAKSKEDAAVAQAIHVAEAEIGAESKRRKENRAVKHFHIATAATAAQRFRVCVLSGSAYCSSPTTAEAVHSSSHAMAKTKTISKAGVPPSVPAVLKPEVAAALPHADPHLHSQSIKTVSNNADDDSLPANLFVF